jgi:hypothetical protein
MTVTPNTLPATGPISRANLNALGNPTVELDAADYAELAAELETTAATVNWLKNSDFRSWTLGTSVSLGFDTWTERADHWEAKSTYTDGVLAGTGASPTWTTGTIYSRTTDAVHTHVLYCARFQGEANTANLYFGQKLSAQVAAGMLENSATLTVEVENKTGATQTVTLFVDSCDSLENYSAMTNRLEVSLGTVANNARTKFTHTFDLSAAATHIRKGARIYVKLPGLGGTNKEWLFYFAKLEPGTVATPRRIEREDSAVSDSAITLADSNFIHNPGLSAWKNTSLTCTAAVDNVAAEGFVIIPSTGSTGVASREVAAPNANSLYALKFTGDAAVSGTVDIMADIERAIAGTLGQDVVFSCYVYNNTGTTVTPSFRLDTCDAENSKVRTNRIDQTLDACGNASWTRLTWTFDGAAVTNIANGFRLGLRFGSGSLDSGAKSIRIAQPMLTIGDTTPDSKPAAPWQPGPLASTARTATGLVIAYATSTTLSFTCTSAVCERADGSLKIARNVSSTLNIATTGANALDTGTVAADTFYAVRVIHNGETAAALMTVEGNTPVLPAGYQWVSGIVGVFRTTSGSQVFTSHKQRSNYVTITLTAIQDATPAASDTWELVTISGGADLAIPTTAIGVFGTLGVSNNTAGRVAIAPEVNGYGRQSILLTNSGLTPSTFLSFMGAAAPFHLPLMTAQTLYVQADSNTMKIRVEITGFELP